MGIETLFFNKPLYVIGLNSCLLFDKIIRINIRIRYYLLFVTSYTKGLFKYLVTRESINLPRYETSMKCMLQDFYLY